MNTSVISNYIKSNFPTIKVYTGAIDKQQDKCIGVYTKGTSPIHTAVGRKESYNVKPISVLVHWTENTDECEQMASNVYDLIRNISNVTVNEDVLRFADMKTSSPIDLGRDERGVCEYVITFDIYYGLED